MKRMTPGLVTSLLVTMILTAALPLQAQTDEPDPVVTGTVRGQPLKAQLENLLPCVGHKRFRVAYQFWYAATARIIKDEISKRHIQPTAQDIEALAQKFAAKKFHNFEQLPGGKTKTYETIHRKGKALKQSLALWDQDHTAGDAYAQKHLIPIEITKENWTWMKLHHDRPDVTKSIETSLNYDDDAVMEQSRSDARINLKRTMLIKQVVSGQPIPDSVEQLFSRIDPARIQLGIVSSESLYESHWLRDTNPETSILESEPPLQSGTIGPWPKGQIKEWEYRVIADAAIAFGNMNQTKTSRKTILFSGVQGVDKQFKILSDLKQSLGNTKPLPPQAKKALQEAWESHVFAQWLVTQLKQDVKLDADSKWAMGKGS